MTGPTRSEASGVHRRGKCFEFFAPSDERRAAAADGTSAEERATQVVAERRALGAGQSFEAYARWWITDYRGRTSHGLTGTTREGYRRSIEHYLIPFFSGRLLASITPMDVRELISAQEERGLALSSIRKNVAPLKCMLATAVEDGLIASHPGAHVRINTRRPQPYREARAMTRAQLRRLLCEFAPADRLFFALLAYSGLRISEQIGLQWQDLALGERPTLSITRQLYRGVLLDPKRRASRRTIPLSRRMAEALGTRREASAGSPTDWVFLGSTGTSIDAANLRKRVLNPAAERAGVPWVGFHTFRHTCASILLETKNASQVAAWLGHADPLFTLRTYTHILEPGLGDAEFLDQELAVALPNPPEIRGDRG